MTPICRVLESDVLGYNKSEDQVFIILIRSKVIGDRRAARKFRCPRLKKEGFLARGFKLALPGTMYVKVLLDITKILNLPVPHIFHDRVLDHGALLLSWCSAEEL
jgi:hypothetical protein